MGATPSTRRHKQYDKDRRSPCKRGYGRDWQAFRALRLQYEPLCHDCGKPANEVHHIRKVSARPDLRLVASNVMSLCTPCHATRTARGE